HRVVIFENASVVPFPGSGGGIVKAVLAHGKKSLLVRAKSAGSPPFYGDSARQGIGLSVVFGRKNPGEINRGT
ncbi:MAG: hypothetical protein IKY16_08640, partial [Bacteroidales bacterium]|nr:hypothetical protein [Bacteroidales bacterium]